MLTSEEVLHAITSTIAETGIPPTHRELQLILGLRSTNTVHYWLKKLESDGLIKLTAKHSRGIRVI